MRRYLPALVLIAMTSVFPELFSGNTPLEALLGVPLILFVFAYGLPILLIREIALRAGTGSFGIFVMGLGYGLINEGLYARTIFREHGLPVDTFDGYGYALHVNWPFAAFICTWHAVASVLLPIVLTRHLFPEAGVMRPRALRLLAGSVFASGTAFFLLVGNSGDASELPVAGIDLTALVALWVAIALIWWLGSRVRAGTDGARDRRLVPFLLGLSGFMAFIMAVIPSHAGWPIAISFGILVGLTAIYTWLFRALQMTTIGSLSWFGLGWYLQTAAFSWTVIAARSPLTVVADLLLLGMVFLTIHRVGRRAIQ